MLCQMCLRGVATVHILDRTPGGPPVASDYCPACYDLKYVRPTARPPDFPRPRFTIRRLMILAALFAIPNAAVMLVMRSGLIPGTPAQLRDWTVQAFLSANVFCGIMAAYILSFAWLRKVEWHRRTGGLVPMEKPRKAGPREYLIAVVLALIIVGWFIGAASVIERVASLVWPGWRPNPTRALWTLSAPIYVGAGLALFRHERVRALWRGASPLERFLRLLGVVWFLVFLALLSWTRWMSWFSSPILSIGVLMAVVMGIQIVIFLALAASVRRR